MPSYASLEAGVLTIGNDLLERRWSLAAGELRATHLVDKGSGRAWLMGESPAGAPVGGELRLTQQRMRTAVSAEFLRVQLTAAGVTWQFDLFDDFPAITITKMAGASEQALADVAAVATGVERDPAAQKQIDTADLVEVLAIKTLHCDFIAVEMLEQTDAHENLVFERKWMLHPAERSAQARGNVFAIEDRGSGEGFVILKHAPAPYARPGAGTTPDVAITDAGLVIRGHGSALAPYSHTIICYRGGGPGRTAAMQSFQHRMRQYQGYRDGLLVSNTWGDRNRDAALCEPFLLAEAEAGARLGVDVLQIDDGWQKGRTANSAKGGGVWSGFWASDERFWDTNAERLPRGLASLVDRLGKSGMSLGLWFAPDSSSDCANWERDADQVLALWREHGVRHVKIDAVKMHTPAAEQNVARFYEKVLNESRGAICFDSDVTAEVRPGFWGRMDAGAIFVENRYTDWHRYWPHHTLRNLWLLAHYIPPVRLRMEFLNASRNAEKYSGDPLAPANYAPDTLFATVMFSSPLAWFEVSRLPENYFTAIAPLVKIWKAHREAIHRSVIQPIGHEPDGFTWTGFMTDGAATRYALVFTELSADERFVLPVENVTSAQLLHGPAAIATVAGRCEIRITRKLSHALLSFEVG